MKRKWKRTLSILLSFAMVFSMTGMNTVYALEGGPPVGASGLCEHHTAHTDECGYTEGTPEVPCAHEHRSECYKEVTKCVHEHSDDCYPAEDSVSDNDATPSDATPKEPTECTHMCSAESGCITTEPDCSHEHEDDCGYAPAVPGTPCAFVCEECAKDSGQPSPEPTPCTRTEGCTLEDGHEGGCDGAASGLASTAPSQPLPTRSALSAFRRAMGRQMCRLTPILLSRSVIRLEIPIILTYVCCILMVIIQHLMAAVLQQAGKAPYIPCITLMICSLTPHIAFML